MAWMKFPPRDSYHQYLAYQGGKLNSRCIIVLKVRIGNGKCFPIGAVAPIPCHEANLRVEKIIKSLHLPLADQCSAFVKQPSYKVGLRVGYVDRVFDGLRDHHENKCAAFTAPGCFPKATLSFRE